MAKKKDKKKLVSASTLTALNPLVGTFNGLASLARSGGAIVTPSKFHDKVSKIKEYMAEDVSGLVSSITDFMVEAALVDFKIETGNEGFNKILNEWLEDINESLRGKKVEVGVQGLAKQYFIERWKNSSLCVMRTIWKKKDGFVMPDKIWYVDGGSIDIKSDKETAIIGNEKYRLKVGRKKFIKLPKVKNEELFVQSPYARWGKDYPDPFLARRGILRNLMFFDEISKVSERIITRSIEYLFDVATGTENLALANKVTYDEDDLKEAKKVFDNFINQKNSSTGVPAYFHMFDTVMQHLIPDYEKGLNSRIYTPVERRLLEGLGIIEIIQGTGTTRTESILNPKPLIREIKQGVKDFKLMLLDIAEVIKEKNKSHTTYTNKKIKIYSSPITDFITENLRDHLRRMYQNGNLSKETYSEVCSDGIVDHKLEIIRRTREIGDGEEELMYAPVIQNTENSPADLTPDRDVNGEEVDDDKQAPDNQDYNNAELAKILEGAPYSQPSELPDKVKNAMSVALQKKFIKIFNNALKTYKGDESKAFAVAWNAIKRISKKGKGGKLVLKKSFFKASSEEILNDLAKIQEIEINEKKILI